MSIRLRSRSAARLGACALLAGAAGGCAGFGGDEEREAADALRGGTLRVLIDESELPPEGFDPQHSPPDQAADPHGRYELYRCCLLRTLLAFPGRPTEQGGSILHPDLAAALPQISPDGGTWTFQLKRGIRYAPPYDELTVTSGDFVRAIERTLRSPSKFIEFNGGRFLGELIAGGEAYATRRADSVSGIETPDDATLVFRLTKPAGHFGNLLAFPALSPIPAEALRAHRRDYGRFLATSGPYMLAGAGEGRRGGPRGYVAGKRATLVRNPSWDGTKDLLRPAYADRIEIGVAGTPPRNLAKVDAGQADVVLTEFFPVPRGLRSDHASLEGRVFTYGGHYNLAAHFDAGRPPFDDVHVRKAVNLAIDKARLQALTGGPLGARVASHAFLDSLENNLLLDYDPYETTGHRGSAEAARREMAKSRYDSDGDGRCDHSACRRILAPVPPYPFGRFIAPPLETASRSIARDIARIGLDLDVRVLAFDDPRWSTSGFSPIGSWGTNFLIVAPLAQLAQDNAPRGARRQVGAKLSECSPLVGRAQFRCWAELDQIVMDELALLAPFLSEVVTTVVSPRVERYSFAQATVRPALDQIALKPDAR